jgi:uncharacterized membrane protein (UPF0127 family)
MNKHNFPGIADFRIEVASSFLERLIGLLGRRSLPENSGLLLIPCNNIHTAFMRFVIDAVFVDDDGIILSIVEKMAPYRMAYVRHARSCLELSSGGAARLNLKVGQKIDALASVNHR